VVGRDGLAEGGEEVRLDDDGLGHGAPGDGRSPTLSAPGLPT
jgi:hypothetical protein